jgi:hypothetical protein
MRGLLDSFQAQLELQKQQLDTHKRQLAIQEQQLNEI